MSDDDRTIEALTELVARLWHSGIPWCAQPATYSAAEIDAWAATNLDDDMRAALNGSLGQSFGVRVPPATGWDSDHPVAQWIYATVDDA